LSNVLSERVLAMHASTFAFPWKTFKRSV